MATITNITPRNTTCLKIGGTDTLRASSSKLLGRWGSNLQNVNKEARKMYVADGIDLSPATLEKLTHYLKTRDLSIFTEEERVTFKIFVQVDQSGADALIVSYLAELGKFRSLFLNSIKPHVFIGLAFPEHWEQDYPFIHEIRKLAIPEIPKHPRWKELRAAIADSDNNPPSTRYYYLYKQTCHSSNYDIKAPTFQMNLLEKSGGKVVISRQQAELYLSGYHGMFPEIRAWQRETVGILSRTRTLYNLFGFPREFNGVYSDKLFKEAYAFVPQSTVGCITHVAFTLMQSYIEDNRLAWDLLNNTHDSYLLQVPIGEELNCVAEGRKFMNQKLLSHRNEAFSMKSEGQIGFNWMPYKPIKNTWGLVEV